MGKTESVKDIIVNEFKEKYLKNSMTMKKKLCSDKEAENGAERYIRIFDAPECRLFFLKVMYHLPYEEREDICAAARREKIKCPKKYFTYCAKRALSKYGY